MPWICDVVAVIAVARRSNAILRWPGSFSFDTNQGFAFGAADGNPSNKTSCRHPSPKSYSYTLRAFRLDFGNNLPRRMSVSSSKSISKSSPSGTGCIAGCRCRTGAWCSPKRCGPCFRLRRHSEDRCCRHEKSSHHLGRESSICWWVGWSDGGGPLPSIPEVRFSLWFCGRNRDQRRNMSNSILP